MKRRVTIDQLRDMVRARRTKGDAFRCKHNEYEATQAKVKAELEAMSFAEIIAKFPEYTYDIKAS